jgi:hypothetical protein
MPKLAAIVFDWIGYLKSDLLWGPDDPLFPETRTGLADSGHIENAGLDRKHWRDAATIRRIFREAFERAGLEAIDLRFGGLSEPA